MTLRLLAAFFSIACATPIVGAQCPNTGTLTVDGVTAVEGKPFQAKELTTIVRYMDNGTKLTTVVKANLFRDSRGRVRVERFYNGTDHPPEDVPSDVSIYDNCGSFISLVPARHTAKVDKKKFGSNKGSDRPYCEAIDPENPPNPGPQGKFEDLGHKTVNGIEVRGERTSYYRSVAEKNAGSPPVRFSESWCSPSLATPMGMHSLDDKPKLELTIIVSDVQKMEPNAELFELPERYTVINVE